jgi:photosystem II stability/assembly factor-like uncharacterized protein
LAVDPQDGRVVYAGGPEGIYRSADRGDTWKRLGGGLGALSVVVDPLNSQVIFAGDKERLHKSVDGGQTWTQAHSGVGMEAVAVSPWDDQLVLTGGWQGIYRSADQGDTWQQVKGGVRLVVLAFDPRDPQVVYAGCIEGLYRSADRGLTWDELYKGNFTQLLIDPRDPRVMNAIAEFGQTTAAVRSADGGKTWNQGQNGPRRTSYGTLVMVLSDPSLLYLASGRGIFKSADSGETWEDIGPGPWLMAVDQQDPRVIYGGTEDWGNSGEFIWARFFRSEDGGRSWPEISLHVPVFAAAFDPKDDQRIYASTDRGVYQSGDAGQRWSLIDTNLVFAALSIDLKAPRALYGGGQQGVYRSEDQGRTWAQLGEMDGRSISSLLTDSRQIPTRIYAISEKGNYSRAESREQPGSR